MAKKVKQSAISSMLIIVTLVLCIILSIVTLNIVKSKVKSEEAKMPEQAISAYLKDVKNNSFDKIYEDSLVIDPHFNSKEDYINALSDIYKDVDVNELNFQLDENGDYSIIDGNKLVSTIRLIEKNGEYMASTIFYGDNTYYIEVPANEQLVVNNIKVSEDHLVNKNISASNFSGISKMDNIPNVDIYKIENLISEPEIMIVDKNYDVIKDALSNTYYIGSSEGVSDEEEYAKKCAEAIIKFPCEDGSLAAVASYSITSSDFYKRISTLQNEWFTPHSIAKLSFGDVKVIKQNDDSFIANVIWNYYISNGSLEREYHGAYQMSFLKVNGTYKLAGFAIDNELNPDNEGAYYD